MSMTSPPEPRVALVTGAGRGIGRAIATALAGEGARVGLLARTAGRLEEVAAELGDNALVLPCDVSDLAGVRAATDRVADRYGGLDVVVHAAGVYGPIGLTHELDGDDWRQAIDVNLVGAFAVAHAAIPHLMRRGGGKLIFLGGGGAAQPLPRFSAYAAAKAGVVRLVDTLAAELADDNIQVNAIAPGLVDTDLQDDVLAAGDRAGPLLEQIRLARDTGKGSVPPELAAELVLFLASARSGSLTGKLIAAPHDPWREWDGRGDELNATPMYSLRRLDPYTIAQLDA